MIPLIFSGDSTDFRTEGIGRLIDVLDITVIEEANGYFELSMKYPANGIFAEYLYNTNIIVADAGHKLKRQAFEIYEVTKPINNIITIYANHISYRQSFIPVKPFTATGITETLTLLPENMLESNHFTFTTDLTNETSGYVQNIPKSLRACLAGSEGSISDTYSGSGGLEFEFDNFNTFITLHRGKDNGVQLRYGKNITDLEEISNIEEVITGVLPYWYNEELQISIYGDIQYKEDVVDDYPYHRTEILDLSYEITETPSVAELNEAARNYLSDSNIGLEDINIKVSFMEAPILFGNIEIFESVNLFDTVHVIYEPLDIQFDSQVIKTTYNVLTERYENIEIGNPKNSLGKTITSTLNELSNQIFNERIVSVTQTIDHELGEIKTAVGVISTTLGDSESGLIQKVNTNSTLIDQKTDSVDFIAYQELIETDLDTLEKRVTETETKVSVSPKGLEVKQNKDDDNYFLITRSDAQVIVDNNVVATFGANGTDTTELTLDGSWHQDTVNNGNTFILYYLNEQGGN